MDIKRPSAKDTDEDILKLQAEFLASKTLPSASIVRPNQAKTSQKHNDLANTAELIEEPSDDAPAVLLNIEERLSHGRRFDFASTVTSESSFPKPFKRTIDETSNYQCHSSGPKPKRISIFAQEMLKRKNVTAHGSSTQLPQESRQIEKKCVLSSLIDGSGLTVNNASDEAKKIHEENLEKIKSMTKEEIDEQRKQLFSQLDPGIVDFLTSKNKPQREKLSTKESIEEKAFKRVSFSEKEEVIQMEDDGNNSKDIQIDPSILPITPEQIRANKWLGMNKIEWKKLEWLKTLPEPKPFDPNTGNSARFDLEGNLVTGRTDIPVYLGLHHHGDEPEQAGYTFEELFRLSRSDLAAQRTMALKTMSNILSLNSRGTFDEVLTNLLLPQLIDSGMVMLLRCACDDEHPQVWAAAISALHSMILSSVDEEALDQTFSWANGHVSPFLCPDDSPIIVDTEDEEEAIENMKDNEIVQKDVILGLLRMDLLPRLRYILEVLRPDAVIVNKILEILIRSARHSPQLAVHIYNCPRLVRVISDSFLPLHWGVAETKNGRVTSSTYGIPLKSALKLFRILAAADIDIARGLLQHYQIDLPVKCYLSCDPRDNRLPFQETLKLSVEAARLWHVLLRHGLSTEIFQDLFPIWMNRLRLCHNLSANDILHRGDLLYVATLISCFDALANYIFNCSNEPIEETHFSSVISLVIAITKKWTTELTEACPNDMSEGWTSLGANLRLLRTFFNGCDKINYRSEILQFKIIVEKWIANPCFANLSSKMRLYSSILEGDDQFSRYMTNLPQIAAVRWGGKSASRILHPGSFLTFQVDLSEALLFLSYRAELTPNEEMFNTYFNEMENYLRATFDQLQNQNPISPNTHWFCRFELTLILNILLISSQNNVIYLGVINRDFLHQVSLLLPKYILSLSDEKSLRKHLDNVIFNPIFYSNPVQEATRKISSLSLSETSDSDCYKILSSIKSDYSQAFHWRFSNPNSTTLVRLNLMPSLLPKTNPWWRLNSLSEWIFIPLTQENIGEDCGKVERCLTFISFLMKHRKKVLSKMSHPGKLFYNISTVFLLDGEPFLVPEVKIVLSEILSFYLNNWPTPNISDREFSFTALEFFEELINQFEASSYGDKLFSNLILVFLQTSFPPAFKTLFFKEHQMALTFLRLSLTESMLPIELFLFPLEVNEDILDVYFQLLLRGGFAHCPLLYAVAIHHLHHYLYATDDENTKFKSRTLKTVETNKNKECCKNLLNFHEICLISRTLKFQVKI